MEVFQYLWPVNHPHRLFLKVVCAAYLYFPHILHFIRETRGNRTLPAGTTTRSANRYHYSLHVWHGLTFIKQLSSHHEYESWLLFRFANGLPRLQLVGIEPTISRCWRALYPVSYKFPSLLPIGDGHVPPVSCHLLLYPGEDSNLHAQGRRA